MRNDDSGFSLIEAVVAAVVLGITATAVAAFVVNALGVTKDNTERTTAASLVATQMETVRAMRALDIDDGLTVYPPVTVAGTAYTLSQDTAYVAQDSNADACQNPNGKLAYKRVTVTATWPSMGSTKPVRSDTLRTLGFGADGLDATKGGAAVKVKNSAGVAVSGIDVTIKTSPGLVAGDTLTTGVDGCVVFIGLVPGNYVAVTTTPGYVDVDSNSSETSVQFGVVASVLSTPSVDYDRPGRLDITMNPPVGYTTPAGLSTTLTSSLWTGTLRRSFRDCSLLPATPQCVSGTATMRSATLLFPAAYGAWAGICADAAPTTLPVNAPVKSSLTAATTANLAGVTVTANVTSANQQVYAVHRTDAVCTAGEVISLGALGATGTSIKVALPYGTWYVQRTTNPAVTVATQQVIVSEAAPLKSVTVTL